MKVPKGWFSHRSAKRGMFYVCAADALVVERVDGAWRLRHEGKDTGHKFATASAAIAYADDVRFHAG